MRVAVVTNPHAGPSQHPTGEEIRSALESSGVDCIVCDGEGSQLQDVIQRTLAANPDAVIASGGDGTVSCVAAALVGKNIPLGIVPSGTLNHFAKDLNIPLDLTGAVRVIVARHVRPVDVGQVNGRTFINNASIGIYPRIVTKRDQIRERLGRGKFIAMFFACLAVFRRYPTIHVRVNSPEVALERRTPFLFIGNNRYQISFNAMGKRTSLNRGELCLYLTSRTGRFALLRLALRGLFGRLDQERDFISMTVPEVHVETRKSDIAIALDGEVHRMKPPLEFRILEGALNVIAP